MDQGASAEGVGEREAEASGQRSESGEADLGKLLSPERRRSAAEHAQGQGLNERRACLLVDQPHGTQRHRATQREDEDVVDLLHYVSQFAKVIRRKRLLADTYPIRRSRQVRRSRQAQ